MYDAVFTERLQRPAVALVNEGFALDARSAASGKGMPGVRVVRETVPCECTVSDRIVSGVRAVMDDIVAALTVPLTAEEQSPPAPEVDGASGVVFTGDLAEVQRFFYRRGWTDGLPIVPPTEAAVEEMLTGTDLARDHIVGKMIPRLGKVTVEKIAINAVMAGALPTYMPLLVAGVEALLDPTAAFGTFEVSTGSWAPFWILNGPIRDQLHVNGGQGALSPGDIANAAIGRAMGLIKHFNENIVPTSAKYGVRVLAAWVNRPQNEFIWVRTFESEDALKRYEASPERAAYLPINRQHLAKTEFRNVEDVLRVPAGSAAS